MYESGSTRTWSEQAYVAMTESINGDHDESLPISIALRLLQCFFFD